jgi:hypothetical protein
MQHQFLAKSINEIEGLFESRQRIWVGHRIRGLITDTKKFFLAILHLFVKERFKFFFHRKLLGLHPKAGTRCPPDPCVKELGAVISCLGIAKDANTWYSSTLTTSRKTICLGRCLALSGWGNLRSLYSASRVAEKKPFVECLADD